MGHLFANDGMCRRSQDAVGKRGRDKRRALKSMEKLGNKVAHGMGRFVSLPDEMLMSILNRIHDLKSLFHCTLLSKDFALNIHRVQSISVKLPAVDVDFIQARINFWRPVIGPLLHEIPKFFRPPFFHERLKFTTFLQKFTELESVCFETACPRMPCMFPLLKWKATSGTCGSAIKNMFVLLPTAMGLEAEYESDEEKEDERFENIEDIYDFLNYPAKGCLSVPLMCFAEWLYLVLSLIKSHRSLRSVTCTDSDKHGTFVLDDKQIVEWRKSLLRNELLSDSIPRIVRFGFVPELRLPLSGYRMKKVFFAIMHFHAGESEREANEMLKYWEYDQEDEVLGEAFRGILTLSPEDMWDFYPWY